MRQLHPVGITGRRVEIEAEIVPLFQFDSAAGENTAAQFRPLQVGQHRDRAAEITLDLADHLVAGAVLVMGAMRHVDAKDIRAGLEQFSDHVIVVRRRPEGGHDLYVSMALHAQSFEYAPC